MVLKTHLNPVSLHHVSGIPPSGISLWWYGLFCIEASICGEMRTHWTASSLSLRSGVSFHSSCHLMLSRLQGREVAQEWRKVRLWRACIGDTCRLPSGGMCLCQGCSAIQRWVVPMEPGWAVWTNQHPFEHGPLGEPCTEWQKEDSLWNALSTLSSGLYTPDHLLLFYYIASKAAKSGQCDFSIQTCSAKETRENME